MDSLYYSLKVWLSSVVIAPLLYIAVTWLSSLNHFNPDSSIDLYPMMFFFELIFSFCTWLTFWCITELTLAFFSNWALKKWLLVIVGITLTMLTFLLFFGVESPISFNDIFFDLMLCNCFCIGVGSWFFKLGSENNVEMPPEMNLIE